VLTFIKKNLNLIYCEFFGEKTDHLLMARALAAIVDYLILITASSVIYFVLTNQTLFTLSLGLIVWIVYFTLGSSRIFKGQTIGKKLFRVRVANREGEYLGLMKSLLRSLFVVLLMNGYHIMYFIITEQEDLYVPVFCGLTTILFGTIYFTLLNLNRQSLHDLVVFSQVIPADRVVKIKMKFNWRLIVGFVVITTVGIIFILN